MAAACALASVRPVDGTILPQHPYAPDASPTAANVPMIICLTENEQAPAWTDASPMNVTLPQVADRLMNALLSVSGSATKRRPFVVRCFDR